MPLSSNNLLILDRPTGSTADRSWIKKYRNITLDSFYTRWNEGRMGKTKLAKNLEQVSDEREYSINELSDISGLCRSLIFRCAASSKDGNRVITGKSFKLWRYQIEEKSQNKLRSAINARQMNEETRLFCSTKILSCEKLNPHQISYTMCTDNPKYFVSGSPEQSVLTLNGWKTIIEISSSDSIMVINYDKPKEVSEVNRLSRQDRDWRRKQHDILIKSIGHCQKCRSKNELQINHIISVHVYPERTFDPTNIELLCLDCHDETRKSYQIFRKIVPIPVKSITRQNSNCEMLNISVKSEFNNLIVNNVVVMSYNLQNNLNNDNIVL